jgi:hypothetical protein
MFYVFCALLSAAAFGFAAGMFTFAALGGCPS